MQTIFSFLGDHWIAVGALISVFVDISPIKINPIKWLFKRAGDLMVGRRLDRLERAVDENEMDRIRSTVLSFATSCRRGIEHTKDEYQHIISLNDKYVRLLQKYGITNGVFSEEYKYILRVYNKEDANELHQ